MKCKDIFGLFVRFFGLICIYQGLNKVPSACQAIYNQFPHHSSASCSPAC